MLSQYYGFQQDPFGVTPDPRFLYQSPTHREALASLQYGFYSNRGFTALIAQPGLGKTTLLFHFLDQIRASARTVFLFHTQCGPQELMRYILQDLGIAGSQDIVEMHRQLHDVLLKEARAGRRVVLVIDEAQNLSEAALESIRLLTNFETPQTKLMQIVLSGQPQLSDTLRNPSLVQLRQRISTICQIESFSDEETITYISHRLKLAGYCGAPLFTEEALTLIAKASQGIPRTINNLCFNALSLCLALKRKQVDAKTVAEVITDQKLFSQSRETSILVGEIAAGQSCVPKQKQFVHPPKLWFSAIAILIVAFALVATAFIKFHWTDEVLSADIKALPASIPVLATNKPSKSRVADIGPNATPFEVIVEPHQTLQKIAIQHLGDFDVTLLHQIQALNPNLINPDLILPGQKIRLPASTASTAKNIALQASVRTLP